MWSHYHTLHIQIYSFIICILLYIQNKAKTTLKQNNIYIFTQININTIMGSIISIVNHKGGVGKTTTSVNLGASLSLHENKKVLLIDLDPQANLSQSLGINGLDKNTIYDALCGKISLPIQKVNDNLDIVVSSLDLSAAEMELSNEPGREYILNQLIEPIKSKYDFIIIDCPPSLGLLTFNALTASTGMVIPVQSEYLALQGMTKLIFAFEKIKGRLNKKLELTGIIMTQFDIRKNLCKDAEITVRKYFEKEIFETKIRDNVSLAEAPSVGQHIYDYAPKSAGAEDYKALTKELIKRTK